jgi:hypothetical protein
VTGNLLCQVAFRVRPLARFPNFGGHASHGSEESGSSGAPAGSNPRGMVTSGLGGPLLRRGPSKPAGGVGTPLTQAAVLHSPRPQPNRRAHGTRQPPTEGCAVDLMQLTVASCSQGSQSTCLHTSRAGGKGGGGVESSVSGVHCTATFWLAAAAHSKPSSPTSLSTLSFNEGGRSPSGVCLLMQSARENGRSHSADSHAYPCPGTPGQPSCFVLQRKKAQKVGNLPPSIASHMQSSTSLPC